MQMKNSIKTRIANIEAMLEELDELAAEIGEDDFSFGFDNIRMKAEDGDSDSTRTIDAMTAFHNALKRDESVEEILQRSMEQPDLQQIIINYVHAMQRIILASKSR